MADIALLTYKPSRCPRCQLAMRVHPEDWAAGSTLGCNECGLLVARVSEPDAIRANTESGGDLALIAPYA